jgi:hypothetical protein
MVEKVVGCGDDPPTGTPDSDLLTRKLLGGGTVRL